MEPFHLCHIFSFLLIVSGVFIDGVGDCIWQVGDSLGADPRMKLMQKVWFENKDVLDIGCNEGHVTISLGTNFLC